MCCSAHPHPCFTISIDTAPWVTDNAEMSPSALCLINTNSRSHVAVQMNTEILSQFCVFQYDDKVIDIWCQQTSNDTANSVKLYDDFICTECWHCFLFHMRLREVSLSSYMLCETYARHWFRRQCGSFTGSIHLPFVQRRSKRSRFWKLFQPVSVQCNRHSAADRHHQQM